MNLFSCNHFLNAAQLANDPMDIGLGANVDGVMTTQLFEGAIYDSYRMRIYVQIFDDDDGFTIHSITQYVTVVADLSDLQTKMAQLVSASPNAEFNRNLNSGLQMLAVRDIQSLSAMLNSQSLSDKLATVNGQYSLFLYGGICLVNPTMLKFIPQKDFLDFL